MTFLLNLHFFNETESTSTLASEWLRSGTYNPPFAVIAATQTSGRGRRGNTWQSPVGNIYLTLAIPAVGDSKRLKLLPLAVAVSVQRWIAQSFGIHIRLKWPNDLLFAGAKLGGILCETSLQGSEQGPVLIGVGINLNSAPIVDYPTVSLRAILGSGELAADVLAKQLAASLYADLREFDDSLVLSRFREASFLRNDPFLRRDGSRLYFYDIDQNGELVLSSSPGTGTLQTIQSVHDSHQWLYQSSVTLPVLIADVGNTRIKVARFANTQTSEPAYFAALDEQLALETLVGAVDVGVPIYLMSVNEILQKTLLSKLSDRPVVHLKKRWVRIRDSKYDMKKIGIDRVAAIEAAAKFYGNDGMPFVVVSSGTATTIDCVDQHRVHLGGWIIPGVSVALSAMSRATEKLPQVGIDVDDDFAFGTQTESAMMQGVRAMVRGAVRRAVKELQKQTGIKLDRSRVLATGGDSDWVGAEEMTVDEHLLVKGALILALS